MKRFAISTLVSMAALAIVAPASLAAEARPWLCRDKPVFSSQQPMSYQLSGNSRWHLFLMKFSPEGGHDGFDIVKEEASPSSGHLSAGRYFAVALHNASGHWICPGYAGEQHAGQPGLISNLCFADQDEGCTVRFTVKSDRATP